MRKFGVIVLLLCYLAFSSGVIINSHYCMNKLASTKLFSAQNSVCEKCGMHISDSHGCCRDEVQIVKMDNDQKAPVTITFDFALLKMPVQVPSEFISASFCNIPAQDQVVEQPPPLLKGQEICLRHCVFRI